MLVYQIPTLPHGRTSPLRKPRVIAVRLEGDSRVNGPGKAYVRPFQVAPEPRHLLTAELKVMQVYSRPASGSSAAITMGTRYQRSVGTKLTAMSSHAATPVEAAKSDPQGSVRR